MTATTATDSRAQAASRRGKANGERGKRAERDVVAWLRDHGHPGADRTVRTGHRTRARVSADRGDIDGTPGLVIQCKDVDPRDHWQIPAWLADTEAQRRAAGADIGILIVKRRGTADVGRWWAWCYLDQLIAHALPCPEPGGLWHVPVQLAVDHVIGILRRVGYGDTP